MKRNFYGFDPSYHVARYNFIRKIPKSRTPLTLAVHRSSGAGGIDRRGERAVKSASPAPMREARGARQCRSCGASGLRASSTCEIATRISARDLRSRASSSACFSRAP